MGYQQYATVDLTEFNYRFTMKEDGSGFECEPGTKSGRMMSKM